MDVYMYKYACKNWWGITSQDIRYVVAENNPHQHALEDARTHTRSQACDVALLQKFKLSFDAVETFRSMVVALPLSPNADMVSAPPQEEEAAS